MTDRGPTAWTDETVLLFDPSVGSTNLGDHVIAASAKEELAGFLRGKRPIEVSTHLPMSWNYMHRLRHARWKFVLGSNLLSGSMNRRSRQWDLTPRSAPLAKGSILMGAGWKGYGDPLNGYTAKLYRYTLNRDLLHSMRDHHAAESLGKAGIDNVLVTGCPSLWKLTPGHCASIPTTPGATVVSTLTDYNQDPRTDRPLLEKLSGVYDRVLFWPQGARDRTYLTEIASDLAVDVLEPSLVAFDRALSTPGTDYCGTRLHAGIRALQAGRRSLVMAIDSRALEMHRSFNLPIAHRGDLASVHAWAMGSSPVELDLPWGAIERWKAQF